MELPDQPVSTALICFGSYTSVEFSLPGSLFERKVDNLNCWVAEDFNLKPNPWVFLIPKP